MATNPTLAQPFPYSLPKNKIRILLLEGISDTAVNVLTSNGYTEIERLTTQMAGLREAIAQLEEGKAWLKELSEARADEIERWRLEHERLRAWTLDRERAVSELMAQAESRGRQS